MDYPLAQWCRTQLDRDSQQFYSLFVAKHQPTTGDVAKLALWMHDAFPESHLKIQDFIWYRLVETDMDLADKVNTAAYAAFQVRRKQADVANQELRRAAQGHLAKEVVKSETPAIAPASKPAEVGSLLERHFSKESFTDICKSVLGAVPNENLPLDDALVTMINLLVFRLANCDRDQINPATVQVG